MSGAVVSGDTHCLLLQARRLNVTVLDVTWRTKSIIIILCIRAEALLLHDWRIFEPSLNETPPLQARLSSLLHKLQC